MSNSNHPNKKLNEQLSLIRQAHEMRRMWLEGWQQAAPYLSKSYGTLAAVAIAGAAIGT